MKKNLVLFFSLSTSLSYAMQAYVSEYSAYKFPKKYENFPTVEIDVRNDLDKEQQVIIYSDISDCPKTSTIKPGWGDQFTLKVCDKFGISLNRKDILPEFKQIKRECYLGNVACVHAIKNSFLYELPVLFALPVVSTLKYPHLYTSNFSNRDDFVFYIQAVYKTGAKKFFTEQS